MINDCIFCAIAAGEVPATIVHRDDDVVDTAEGVSDCKRGVHKSRAK